MSGQTYLVNKSEYQSIMGAEKGIFIPRLEVFINKSSISTAYPENKTDEIEDRKKLDTGVLHDGTRVRRHFGEWVDADNQVPDDNGKYMPVRLDPNYYPEVAIDKVFTEKEFSEVKELLPGKRLLLLLHGEEERIKRIENNTGGFKQLME